MKAFRSQLGMTYLGMLVVLMSVGGVLWVGFKIVPPYFNNTYVVAALSSLAEFENTDEGLEGVTNGDIRRKLENFFIVNNIRDLSVNDIEIDRQRNKFLVNINYEVRQQFIENIDIVISFKNQFDSSRPHECCDPVSE